MATGVNQNNTPGTPGTPASAPDANASRAHMAGTALAPRAPGAPEPDFDRAPLVAAIAQDATSREVLMIAWMDREAWNTTIETGYAHYHSRSRERLWKKGETSGNVQRVREIRVDCDEDAVLMIVDQTGPACHTGNRTCFYREGFGPS